jgi:hypothetical protein
LIVSYEHLEGKVDLPNVERREYAISQCAPLHVLVRCIHFVVDVLGYSNTNIAPLGGSAFEVDIRVMVRSVVLEVARVRRVKELCAQATKIRMPLLYHDHRELWGDRVIFVALCDICRIVTSEEDGVNGIAKFVQGSWPVSAVEGRKERPDDYNNNLRNIRSTSRLT